MIVSLCSIRAWRADELALPRRASNDLQENYLKQMVEENILERTHPQTPNHPQQAYRAPQDEVTFVNILRSAQLYFGNRKFTGEARGVLNAQATA